MLCPKDLDCLSDSRKPRMTINSTIDPFKAFSMSVEGCDNEDRNMDRKRVRSGSSCSIRVRTTRVHTQSLGLLRTTEQRACSQKKERMTKSDSLEAERTQASGLKKMYVIRLVGYEA